MNRILSYTLHALSILFMCLTMLGCGDKEPENPVEPDEPVAPTPGPDRPEVKPEGIETARVLNTNQGYGMGMHTKIHLDKDNHLTPEAYGWDLNGSAEITCIGKVSSLEEITDIPEDGWGTKCGLAEGYGYISRVSGYNATSYGHFEEYVYTRIFVEKYEDSISGGMKCATISYQTPFQSSFSVSKTTLEFPHDSQGSFQMLTVTGCRDMKIISKPEWIYITRKSDNALTITTTIGNITDSIRTGTIKIGNSIIEMEIVVNQQASPEPLFEMGSGYETDPYIISTANQLDNVRRLSGPSSRDVYFKLACDIDVSDLLSDTQEGWVPIDEFQGIFDGDMHKITGLWIKREKDNQGLFGTVYEHGCSVKRLILELSDEISARFYVAGIVARVDPKVEVMVHQCMVVGTVEGYLRIAGIIGSGGHASQCAFIGFAYEYQWATLPDNLAGINCDGTATNCYVFGQVDYPNDLDGIKRYWGATSSFCLFNDWKDDYNYDPNLYINAHRIIDTNHYVINPQLNKESYRQSTYVGWDFNTIWEIDEGKSLPRLRCFRDFDYPLPH